MARLRPRLRVGRARTDESKTVRSNRDVRRQGARRDANRLRWRRQDPTAVRVRRRRPASPSRGATVREHLARSLEEAGAPSYFIQRVRDGVKEELWDIVRRAKGGEFDAP